MGSEAQIVMAHVGEWFRGRRVFVTGHTGFKGSWLSVWLRKSGARVTGYALAPERDRPSLFEAARIDEGIVSHIGDVRDPESLERALVDAKPEVVFHMAAQSLVRRSYADPVGTFATNVIGTANLLDAARRVPALRAIVVITSDKCYENRDLERGYREDDPMGGHDPYSASKGCQELTTSAFRRSFLAQANVQVASARAGNVIGGGDWSEDRLIADLIMGAARGQPTLLRNPHSVRPWQFVLEPLRGYLMLAKALVEEGTGFAEGWNFGPDLGDAVPVHEVAAMVSASWPRVVTATAPQGDAVHEARILRLDNSKAAARLGWRPALSLRRAITMTVDWYRAAHEQPALARAKMEEQLDEYERLVAGSTPT